MARANGELFFEMGKTAKHKPAESGACVTCGEDAYNQRFTLDTGWRWYCHKHLPGRPHRERRFAPGTKNPMGYVPPNYGQWREQTIAGLKSGDLVARDAQGNEHSDWQPREL